MKEIVSQEPAAIMCPPNNPVADDPFDLNKLRLSQDFAANLGVKKALLTVPVRKPNRQEFIRVHPDVDWRLQTVILDLKEEQETYLVDPNLWGQLPGELIPMVVYTVMNRQGVLMLWPIRLPGEDGRHNEWHRSALEAAEMAQKEWIRVAANKSLGAYEVYQAVADIPEPEWPDTTFQEILRVAFKDRFIRSSDHPVVRRLRGEI
ncbi:MAG: hypothetical protein ACLQUS_14800 [Desulfobaccales bacterium]